MSETATTKAAKKVKKNELRDTIVVIIEALLIALVFRTFLYQPFSIPTASMQSTLEIGDYFVADKWIWGLGSYSFPLALPFSGRILAISQPQRGDIAVFHNAPTGEDYIKRIIGMPGDRIQMKEGRLYINGTLVPREEAGEFKTELSGHPFTLKRYVETLPGGHAHDVLEISDHEALDNTEEFEVPAGHYFMMGDNRDDSLDSRVPATAGGVGYVPAENLVGRADLILYSRNEDVAWWQISEWPHIFRRFFHPIG